MANPPAGPLSLLVFLLILLPLAAYLSLVGGIHDNENCPIHDCSLTPTRCLNSSSLKVFSSFTNFDHKILSNNFAQQVQYLIDYIENGVSQENTNDPSIYTGISGISYLFWQISRHTEDNFLKSQYLQKAKKFIDQSFLQILSIPSTSHSFLNGDAGVFSLRSVIYHDLGDKDTSKICFQKLMEFCDIVLSETLKNQNELMFGRSGYLWAVKFTLEQTDHQLSSKQETSIKSIIDIIFHEGVLTGLSLQVPLLYSWSSTYYLGMAHGLAGIIYTLLHYNLTPSQQTLILKSIDYLSMQHYPLSNNIKSSLSSNSDNLVQWCHGSPGILLLFLKASEVFPSHRLMGKSWLEVIVTQAQIVSSRGLLKKGKGLCHGTAGNALILLSAFSSLENISYLLKSIDFGLVSISPYSKSCFLRDPPGDRPLSLFEGLSGTALFYLYLSRCLLGQCNFIFPGTQITPQKKLNQYSNFIIENQIPTQYFHHQKNT